MKKTKQIYLLIAVIMLYSAAAKADPYIYIHLSFKCIINPVTGQPAANANRRTIENSVATMNNLMETYWRGYRFIIQDITNTGRSTYSQNDPSSWYRINFFSDSDFIKDFDDVAKNKYPNEYNWNRNAINIYIQGDSTGGGICSFPREEVIVVGNRAVSDGTLVLHEIGHYFNLCHTQGCSNGCDDRSSCSNCDSPSDDKISDTVKDLPCWTISDILNNNQGASQEDAFNVFENVMSYHQRQIRLTEQQLDRWADALDATDARIRARTGASHFVNVGINKWGNATFFDGGVFLKFILESQININGGDIVYLRSGQYKPNAPLRIGDKIFLDGNGNRVSQKVTLRATRSGPVTIGK